MQTVSDPRRLEKHLRELGLHRLALGPEAFRLVRFEKGELLISPDRPMDQLLIVVSGKVHIYGLREDGSSFSVFLEDSRAVLGDLEYVRRAELPFYTEAMGKVLCVALPVARYRPQLDRDPVFLHFLLDSLGEKVQTVFLLGNSSQPVEEKLLAYLRDIQPDHRIHNIHSVTMKLQCSRSQLQRAVRSLCARGLLERTGKGRYRLTLLP